jgi:predicted anti-sigma-YlaC factor YlaD
VTTDVDRCTEWRSLASCRLDGELDDFQSARLARHLRGCAACRSWTRDVAALGSLLHELEPVRPASSFEFRAQGLRRRLVRVSAVGATAVSAAAVAAFAIVQSGDEISRFSFGGRPVVPAAPCVSCMKKKVLTFAGPSPATAVGPIHVLHPLDESGVTSQTP